MTWRADGSTSPPTSGSIAFPGRPLAGARPGAGEWIVERLPAGGSGWAHYHEGDRRRRADGALYVSIGSASDNCQAVAPRSMPQEGQWPCPELSTRAGIWRFAPPATGRRTVGRESVCDRAPQRDGAGAAIPRPGRSGPLTHGRDFLNRAWGWSAPRSRRTSRPSCWCGSRPGGRLWLALLHGALAGQRHHADGRRRSTTSRSREPPVTGADAPAAGISRPLGADGDRAGHGGPAHGVAQRALHRLPRLPQARTAPGSRPQVLFQPFDAAGMPAGEPRIFLRTTDRAGLPPARPGSPSPPTAWCTWPTTTTPGSSGSSRAERYISGFRATRTAPHPDSNRWYHASFLSARCTPSLAPAALAAQGPAVGDVAPAFSMTVSGKDGTSPRSRSPSPRSRGRWWSSPSSRGPAPPGCTIQMKAYRDRYAELFGKDVELIAISTDTPEAQAVVGQG